MFLSRAMALAAVVCAFMGCQSSNTSVSFARPKAPSAQSMQQALGGTGYSGTATFSAPVVDPNTWTGSPIGTGSWSAQSTPPQSGGQQAIGADDLSDPSQPVHYIVVGNLSGGPSAFFGIISLGAFTVGTTNIDNVNTFAGIFDGNSGDPIALATSGTVTLTAAGATVTGSFNGTLEDYASNPPPPACRTNADCATGQVCTSGQCVTGNPPPPPPPPACRTNADCATGQTCSNGQCVTGNPPPPPPPPACVVDSDCARGQVCAAGQCVTGPVTGNCDGQGTGAYSGSAGANATCSALGSGAFSLSQGMAAIGEDENGQLALYVVDPNGSSDGVVIPLNACPAASGAVQVSGAQLYQQVNAGAGLTLFAIRDAAGTVTFTGVGAHLTGTFSLSITGGGSLTGSFDVQ